MIKCVVACHNASGEPDFYFCVVDCSAAERDDGVHYDVAEYAAGENGYEHAMVIFDEQDGPRWLFEHFVWESAETYHPDILDEDEDDEEDDDEDDIDWDVDDDDID